MADAASAPSPFRASAEQAWCLLAERDRGLTPRVPLDTFPFRIGRQPSCDLHLDSPDVSRRHAEIFEHNGGLWLRECGSTNGTFINHKKVLQTSRLESGDVIHFASAEFQLCLQMAPPPQSLDDTLVTADSTQGRPPVDRQDRFQEMLRRRSVIPFFQPMLWLDDDRLLGYEILGRCNFDGMPRLPLQALSLAGSTDQQIELSELFREVGLRQANRLGNRRTLFLNAAPLEVELARLENSLTTLRHYAPQLPMVLEINENAVTSRRLLRELRALLRDLDVGLAYDDFGVGRARLLEIIEQPPDWLKFDLMLVQSLRDRSGRAGRVLGALVSMARDLGIRTVAEGVEDESDLEACRRLGFDVAQGYHIGRPMPFLAEI